MNDFRIDHSSGYYAMELQFPLGMLWDRDTSDFSYNGVRLPDSLVYDSAGRTIQVFWKNTGAYPQASRNGNNVIKPKFTLDCTIPNSSGLGSFILNAWDVENANCNCSEPFLCNLEFVVNKHCAATCDRGGVIPYLGSLERINLGLPDNNEDGAPDGSGSLNMSLIELDKAIRGDTFKTTSNLFISVGSQSPSSFTHGYAEISIPTVGSLIILLRVEASVKDFSTGVTHVLSGITSSASTSGGDRTFIIDYSPSTATGYPGSYTFDTNDSFWFEVYYVVSGSPTSDLSSNVELNYYVSPYASPTNDTAKYKCDYYNPSLTAVQVYNASSPSLSASSTGCNQIIGTYRSYFSVGACCQNYYTSSHFPYEYRDLSSLDSMVITLPQGYRLDSAYCSFGHTLKKGAGYFQNAYSLLPYRTNGSTVAYDLGSLYTTNGGNIIPSKGGDVVQLFVYMSPSCEVTPGTVSGGNYTWYRNNTTSLSWMTPQAYSNQQNTTYLGPDMNISNFGTNTATTVSDVVSWDVSIQNNSVNDDATNSWIGYSSLSGSITVDSIRDLTTNTLLVESGGIFRMGTTAQNGVVKNYRVFATYSSCENDSITLYTSWNCSSIGYPIDFSTRPCEGDSVKVYLDRVDPVLQTAILSQPSNPSDLCDTLVWEVAITNPQNAPVYNLYLDVEFEGGGVGVQMITPFEYKYPYNTSNYTDIHGINQGGGVYRLNLSDSITGLGTGGLRPSSESPSNQVYVRIKFLTDCDFTSGNKVNFNAVGTNSCNSYNALSSDFSGVFITGAPSQKLYTTSVSTSVDTLKGCGVTTTVTAKIINDELSKSQVGDSVILTLVEGVEFVLNSSSFSRNAFDSVQPYIDTLNGLQRLIWGMDSAVPASDSSIWSFSIQTNSNSGCTDSSTLYMQSLSTFSASCATVFGGTCNSKLLNDQSDKTLVVLKPKLTIPSMTAKLLNFSPDHTYSFRALVNNDLTGSQIGAGDSVAIDLYFDMNTNGVFDPGVDRLVATKYFNYGFQPGESKSLYGQFQDDSMPDAAKSLFAVINPATAPNCNCSQEVQVGPFVLGLPIVLDDFNAQINKNVVDLTWSTRLEINSAKFEVQRKRSGLDTFENIGVVTAAGNSNKFLSYAFTDVLEKEYGVVFYRLNLVDLNGEEEKSEVKYVYHNPLGQAFLLYPNPANDILYVKGASVGGITYSIYSVLGGVLYQGDLLKDGKVDISYLDRGMYFLSLKLEDGSTVSRQFVKE